MQRMEFKQSSWTMKRKPHIDDGAFYIEKELGFLHCGTPDSLTLEPQTAWVAPLFMKERRILLICGKIKYKLVIGRIMAPPKMPLS